MIKVKQATLILSTNMITCTSWAFESSRPTLHYEQIDSASHSSKEYFVSSGSHLSQVALRLLLIGEYLDIVFAELKLASLLHHSIFLFGIHKLISQHNGN